MKKLHTSASLLTALGAGALMLVAFGPTGALAATRSARPDSIIHGGVVKYAEGPGGNPNYIFPVNPSADQSSPNLAQFQPLMYQPLWTSNFNEPTINYADSIGNAPVWSHGDTEATVTLKHYLWSNGTPVTTRDITFYINLAKAAGPNWGDYTPGEFPYNVKAIKIESPTKMTFTFTKAYNPTYYIDNQLSDIIPIPQNVWDRESLNGPVGNYDETPAGAKAVWNFLNKYAENTGTYSSTNKIWGDIDGAYKLKSFGGSSSPDIFVPNPKYSGHRSTISEFEELPFTSDSAEYDELRTGTSALTLGYVPFQDIPTIPTVESAGFSITTVNSWGVDYIIPNLANPTLGPVLRQLYVRQALQHLVDQKTMIKDFLHGYGIPTYGPAPIYPLGNRFADSFEKHNLYPYSVATADRILEGHGWRVVNGVQTCEDSALCGSKLGTVAKGTQLKLSLLYSSGSTALTEQDELFEADAARAHIDITLKSEPFNTVVGIVSTCNPKDPTEAQCTWQLGEYGGIDYSLFPSGGELFEPGGALNAGSFDNATINTLIHKIRHSATLQAYYEYENLIAAQLPWIWQPTASGVAAVAKDIHGPGLTTEFGDLTPNLWYYTR
jgi:peptide/nickel transport system substrate-binding protein